MFNVFTSRRKKRGVDPAIEAEKMLGAAAVKDAQNAVSKLQIVLDQMSQTNEERRNAQST